jgi:hypothetical protein
MKNILRLTAVGVGLAGLFWIAPRTIEAASSSMTYLTFSGAVALPGVTLAAGTYMFDLRPPIHRSFACRTVTDRKCSLPRSQRS